MTRRSRPKARPPVRRRTVLQGLDEEAELGLGLLGREARAWNMWRCTSAEWMRMEPPPTSLPVEHHVVGTGQGAGGSLFMISRCPGAGEVKGWWQAT